MPSHADRVRLRAVCRLWRAAAHLQPPLPPLLPWILQPDGTLLSLPDGAVHRIPVPDDVCRRMSTGGMLFLVHSNYTCSLLNPFSRETTGAQHIHPACLSPQPIRIPWDYNVRKVVMMPDHIITVKRAYYPETQCNNMVCIRRRRSTATVDIRWVPSMPSVSRAMADVALFQDKLYALVGTPAGTIHLYVLDIIDDKHVALQRVLRTPVDDDDQGYTGIVHRYLVASGDRLLMVKERRDRSPKLPSLFKQPIFDVSEAADLCSGGGRWRKVDTLTGRALFLSQGCSESLPAGGPYVGAREDCVYFLCERHQCDHSWSLCSGMYNVRQGTVSPLPFKAMVAEEGPGTTSWLFPPTDI
ncbi:hypothetical protein CFC21_039863 [Triticum aestivum]|uniref:KIB1-4 beta-propeller domain-containing protein n=2 Tax=Triticum aestivum TaxID=4565 RepID=A0A9R1FF02_WHEAT|nr:hypothetical protein CFC21_039863 [Triticum aestivum]